MEFKDKLIELKINTLNNIHKTQKDKHGISTYIEILVIKYDNQVTFIGSERLW